MRIQIASDLHLEFPENRKWLKQNPLIKRADVLILAGDIILNKKAGDADLFYKDIRKNFKDIIQIPGNHEYYFGEIAFAYPNYYIKLAKNHIMANNKTIIMDNVKFILSTLWSLVPEKSAIFIQNRINDYQTIYSKVDNQKPLIGTDTTNKYHISSLRYIREELEKDFDGKVVVVTHHIPSFEGISKRFIGDELNFAFASELKSLILKFPKIKLWLHGHSHDFKEIKIGETKIVRNPLGYVHQNEQVGFKRDFVVEV